MNLLASAHARATLILFDEVGIPEGARCVDLGCGGGHVTTELARRVGPSGSVLGIDLDEELLALARDEAGAQQLANVTFLVSPVEQLSARDFDVAYARMLLEHLGDPAAMVARIAAAMKPGGLVILEDTNFNACFTEPECPAYDKWVSWFKESVRRTGGDLDLGPRLPTLLRAAGFVDIGVRVAQPAYLDGPVKQLQQLSMEKIRASVLDQGIASPTEFDEAHGELKAFTNDPTTLVASPRMIQAWGRRA
jgi:SAM-dependent methyltransferase